ncbi:MAG: LCP family protein [Anaerolineae bacterium]|jgi:LCP family protein required for cell wall assembly|nr:LCP family protein [Anaerolineae bacterium]
MRRIVFGGLLLALLFGAVGGVALAQDDAPPVQGGGRWDGQSRFTVLVMGMDRRPGARDTLNTRTDAILVVSFDPGALDDPIDDSIGVLHIPRDIHITPLDVSTAYLRVNTLMVQGEAIQENYGPFYAMDTISYNLGMYIDGFVTFDFEAFISIVDALGGVEIDVPYAINDQTYPDMNYGFDPFSVRAGPQLMDGETALKYSRTRHNDNDYQRGERQMQVLTAVGLKATDASVLPGLLLNAPTLLSDLTGHVYTDLTMDEMVPLALFAARVPAENVRTGSVSGQYMASVVVTGDGGTLPVPNYDLLPDLMREVFGATYAPGS